MNERPRGREFGDGSREWPDDLDEEADDCPAIAITFFRGYSATTKTEQLVTLDELARRIEETTSTEKASLPWLKCARFGDIRTDKASLRWDGNLLAITGIEADYDGEQISFETACDVMRRSGVVSIVYTSPSHTEDTPRWRALCPLSQEYTPDRRDAFLARLNGLFVGGIFSRESWTLSQSYYYGSINSNPSHRVAVLAGKSIDQADELDATAVGRPEKPRPNGNGQRGPIFRPESISSKRIAALVESLLAHLRSAPEGSKHHTLFSIGRTLGGYLWLVGWSQQEAVEQLLGVLPPSVADWDAARKTATTAVALGATQPLELEERRMPPGQRSDTDQPPPDHPRLEEDEPEPEAEDEPLVDAALPDLFVMKADLPLVSQNLRDHLATHPWMFERGGPVRLMGFPPETNRLAEINQLSVEGTTHAAHEVCRPYQIDYRGKRSNVTLPERVAKLYLALNGRWNLRTLQGICASVLLDNDGSIHAHEGYHAPSGMWCTQPPLINVPARPFKDQAVDALNRLRAAMATFTFKGSPLVERGGNLVVDIEQQPSLCESAALCGLLTAVVRPSLTLAPGLMVDAPALSGSGAGKGLLVRMIVAIAYGIIPEAGTAGHDEAEFEKRIATALLAGEPVIFLDNLNNMLLRSPQLESCLTEPLVSLRIFGHLEKRKVRANAFVAVTGNGLQASGDTARRFVRSAVEPPLENPEQRKYPPGFLAGILARRAELLSDCLTIWRYGRQQPDMKRGLPFGNYDDQWSPWVRDPLLALGCDDPVKGVQEARERDPARVNISALFTTWRVWHGSDWVKADDLDFHVRRLIDDKERVPAIRQKLAQLVNTRLGGFRLEGQIEGNAANRAWVYRVVEADNC